MNAPAKWLLNHTSCWPACLPRSSQQNRLQPEIHGARAPAHEAAFHAISSLLLQILEGISRHKVPGHVWLRLYSAKAADKVRKAGVIALGVKKRDEARLTTAFVSQEGKALKSC